MRLQPVPSQPRIYGPPVPSFARPFHAHTPLIRELRPRGEHYGIGWFGVFVTWIATMTLGALVATNLPAHIKGHARLVAAAAPPSRAPSPAPATPSAPAGAAAVAPAVAAIPATTGTPAVARPAAAAPPEVGVSELPRAPAIAIANTPHPVAMQVHVRHAARAAAPPPAADDDQDEAPAAAAPPPKPAPARRAAPPPAEASDDDTPTPAAAPPPPPKPVAEAAPPPPKPAPTATFAPGSLEDLIRKEVDKEQKKIHHK
jgi:hypothetical protein